MMILNIEVSLSLALPIKSKEPDKTCLTFEKRGNHPLKVLKLFKKLQDQVQRIRKPYCSGF